MNFLKVIFIISSIFVLNVSIYSQENNSTPERSPEQEAAKQTEMLQQELNLNAEQSRIIHEINLKYARERQNSNSRSEALRRIKNKESELQQVLNSDQYDRLQSKRYERSSFQAPVVTRNSPTISTGYRSTDYKPAVTNSSDTRQQNNNSGNTNNIRTSKDYNSSRSTSSESNSNGTKRESPTISRRNVTTQPPATIKTEPRTSTNRTVQPPSTTSRSTGETYKSRTAPTPTERK